MMQIHEKATPPPFALFELGFRPFFTLAGVSSVLLMLIWMLFYFSLIPSSVGSMGVVFWHAHEMIFGYGMAVIAGFLLTAVTNWTGVITWKHFKLSLLATAWLAARIVILVPSPTALMLAGLFDLLFLLGLLVGISIPVFKVRQWKQMGILTKILLMLVANLVFYAGALGYLEQGMFVGLYMGLYLVLALLFMMLRRVVPFFIERGVGDGFKAVNRRWLDISSILLFSVWAVVDIFFDAAPMLMLLSVILFVLHVLRLSGWYHPSIFRQPLLWSLFVGYIALAGGFLLKAFAVAGWVPASLALHMFTVGGIGLMTLGMMSRVTLGHTGRDIFTPPRPVTGVFLLLLAALAFRVLLPIVDMSHYAIWIAVSQLLWMLSFVIFAAIYIPQLATPRVDGRPG